MRLLYLLEQGGTSPLFYQPMLDEREAVDAAVAILRGSERAEPYFKAPGYGWLLAAVIGISGEAWPWVIRTLQHIAGAAIVAMAAALAGWLCPQPRWRRVAVPVAGLLSAVYGPLIRLESNISLDFWVVFFQSTMFYFLCRLMAPARGRKLLLWAFAAGLFAAAAWLTRPTITVVFPFAILWVFLCVGKFKGHGMAAKLTILFLLPVSVALAGIMARNYLVSGNPRAMPWQGGYSLYHANRPGANGRYFVQPGISETNDANPTRLLAISGYTSTLSPKALKEFEKKPSYSAVNSYWTSRTVTTVREDPQQWAELMGKKSLYLFTDKEIFNYEEYDLQRDRSPLLRYLPGRFGIAFPLALASLATLAAISPLRRRMHWLLWLYVLTLGGGIALYYTSGRMRMPLAFPAVVLSGVGTAGFVFLRWRGKFIAVLLLASGIAISWTDWWGVRSESMAHVDLARMSNAAWHHGRFEQALDLALQAEKLQPDYPGLPRLKGQALYSLGQLKKAEVEFEISVKVLGDETSKKNLQVVREELRKIR